MKTYRVLLSQDVTWLSKMWGDYLNKEGPHKVFTHQEQTIDIVKLDNELEATSEQKREVKGEEVNSDNLVGVSEVPSCLTHEMRNLDTFYNPTMQGLHDVGDVACLTTAVDSNSEELQTFQQVWNHPDKHECEGWRCGIKKELEDMQPKRFGKSSRRTRFLTIAD